MKTKTIRRFSLLCVLGLLLTSCNLDFSDSSSTVTTSETTSENNNTSEQTTSENTTSETTSQTTTSSIDVPDGYHLVWSDEFNGTNLDLGNWEYQVGDGSAYGIWGWGNNEKQYYTQGENARVADGNLIITAKRESRGNLAYTSTRIRSKAKQYWTYGRFEARISYDCITGLWPAFWMLPEDNEYGGWPNSGEIDIMEGKGRLPNWTSHALHYGGVHHYESKEVTLSTPASEYHIYGLEWTPDYIAWFVDGSETFRLTKDIWYNDSPNSYPNGHAPFDKPFHFVINLAVGGNFDGGVEPPADFIQADMRIDYVRVFQKN